MVILAIVGTCVIMSMAGSMVPDLSTSRPSGPRDVRFAKMGQARMVFAGLSGMIRW